MQQYNKFCAEQRRAGNWPMAKQDIYERAYEAGMREGYLSAQQDDRQVSELRAHIGRLQDALRDLAVEVTKNPERQRYESLNRAVNVLVETTDIAVSEIQAEAVESAAEECKWWRDPVTCFVSDLKEHAQQLRTGGNDNE